jgi:signal transduction histidine kinase
MSTEEQAGAEREHTDESLRVERAKVDLVIADQGPALDDAADAVIETARARADAVLSDARSRSDRRSVADGTGAETAAKVATDRLRADRTLRQERATAADALRVERAEQAALLATEREATDKDLSDERARADLVVAARDEFLGIVSHDLRGMLHVVIGFAAMIEQEEPGPLRDERVFSYSRRIQRSGARMNRLVGDLVDVASIHAGRLSVVPEVGDAAPVVTEAVEAFQPHATASKVTLTAAPFVALPLLPFDAARILQVLTNLLSNAIKFTPQGGNVHVEANHVDDEVCFSVTDTGHGVPSQMLDVVFDRFLQVATNDRRGVGLGLYISKCIVQGHGGRIWAESTMGTGSRFSFALPVHPQPPSSR